MRSALFLTVIPTIAFIFTAITSAQDPAEFAHVHATRVLGLLKSPAVRKELQLVAEQIDDLIKLELLRSQLTSKLFRINDLEYEERKRIYSAYRQEVVNLEQQTAAILLPHQLKRLNQIVIQEMVQAGEPHCGLIHNRVIDDLGLVEPQLQVVRAKAVDADSKFKRRVEELQAELAKAKEEMRADVLSALTPEQRKKYEELVGTPVKLRDE